MKSVRLSTHLVPANRLASSMILVFFLCVACFVSRLNQLDAHWSADEARWLRRSAVFIDSVQGGRFERTLIAYHPGVMTMWLAGLRTFLLDKLTWRSLKDLLFARYFVGLVVLSGLIVTFFLLIRLFPLWPTTFAWSFLAINPFFLAQSRRVHTDALAAVFILLTMLLFLLYCETPKQRRYLIFSGVAFGLACLSKSYSLILLLWIPMCLLLFRKSTPWREFLYTSFGAGIVFLNCSLLTVFVLWPVFWNPAFLLFGLCLGGITVYVYQIFQEETEQRPLPFMAAFFVFLAISVCTVRVVLLIFDRITWAVTTPHEVEHFFLGKVVYDPGVLFYPFALSIKSAPVTVPLAVFGVVLLWKQRKGTYLSAQRLRIVFSLILGVLLFILCLTLTSKKFSRYLLPVFPMVDMLAGLGLFYGVKWGGGVLFRSERLRQVWQIACVVLVFALTAIPVFALHPYYGTYYNFCWKFRGITEIISVGDASGLDIAARYINQRPNADQMSVQVSPLATEFFQYYFVGTAYRAAKNRIGDTSERRPADYEVVYIRDSQIGRVPQTGTRNGQLEHTITLNGIEHVWIYRVREEEK